MSEITEIKMKTKCLVCGKEFEQKLRFSGNVPKKLFGVCKDCNEIIKRENNITIVKLPAGEPPKIHEIQKENEI